MILHLGPRCEAHIRATGTAGHVQLVVRDPTTGWRSAARYFPSKEAAVQSLELHVAALERQHRPPFPWVRVALSAVAVVVSLYALYGCADPPPMWSHWGYEAAEEYEAELESANTRVLTAGLTPAPCRVEVAVIPVSEWDADGFLSRWEGWTFPRADGSWRCMVKAQPHAPEYESLVVEHEILHALLHCAARAAVECRGAECGGVRLSEAEWREVEDRNSDHVGPEWNGVR